MRLGSLWSANMIDSWLEAHAPGYSELSEEERTAIKEFALVWSLFEAFALDDKGSANTISTKVKGLAARGILETTAFTPQMAYFFGRYFDGTSFTHHFSHLNLRANDKPKLVENVVSGAAADDESKMIALLIIIYRLRNNLLHGPKWSYGIKGQLGNFQNATAALMTYLERY
jgi:hypothetical protein